MPTFVQELVKQLHSVHTLPMQIQHNDSQLLVTLLVNGTRNQAVKVMLRAMPGALGYIVNLQSRVGVARSHQSVRSALIANDDLHIGGLALNTTTAPPSIDVNYSLVADRFEMDEFLFALQLVAQYADALEQRTAGSDEF